MRTSRLKVHMAVAAVCVPLVSIALATWPSDPTVNLPIATNLFSHEFPQVARDGAGGVIIVWEDWRDISNVTDIYAQRVSAAGDVLWTVDGELITNAAGYQSLPQIVSDGGFGAIIVWKDYRSATDWDVFAQRVDPFGQVVWESNGVAICTADSDQVEVDIISDGLGGAIVTWTDSRSPTSDIYAQRVDANGSVLWATDGVPICAATDVQEDPHLVSDGSEGAIITWMDFRNQATSERDIYAQRVDANGTTQWTANGVAVCTFTQLQTDPRLASDGAGGAIITWEDRRPAGFSDIYAQRVDAGGNALWTVNGVVVCAVPEQQLRPKILADGSSGAFVSWTDRRNGSGDLFAQRLNGLGNSLWMTNGIPVSTAVWGQSRSQLVSDGQGGAIITWKDSRNERFETDIYAQRVDPNGSVLWTTDGVAISRVPENQHHFGVVPDGQGGAIVAWEDWRDGGLLAQRYRVYAQRVDSSGALTVPTGIKDELNRPPQLLTVFPNTPNPFGRETRLVFELSRPSDVTIEIFDVTGRRVFFTKMADVSPGNRSYLFDGRDLAGRALPAGVYLYRVKAGKAVQTRKLVIVR